MPLSSEEFEKLPENSRSLVVKIIGSNPGISQEGIRKRASEVFGRTMSQGFAYRWCKILTAEGQVIAKKVGKKNTYYPTALIGDHQKAKIWYRIEPNQEGELVVTGYTVGNTTQQLKNLPMAKLADFHKDQMKYEGYF